MPLRRYHTPSFVRQTSSASIFPPLVSTITGLPPWRFPIPGPLVDTGSLVERVCAVENFSGDVRGDGAIDGDGDGDGETSMDGDGVAEGAATGSTVVTGVSVAAEAFGC
jgi:hypothetical protein